MDKKTQHLILRAQKNEITEHHIYHLLSNKTKSKHNKEVLEHIAKDELGHYNYWKKLSKKEVHPDKFKIFIFTLIAKIFGLAFTLKLMESGEKTAKKAYKKLGNYHGVKRIIHDEYVHEKDILRMLREERIEYASSTVLGLNDALVELTGALAGLTLALQNSVLVATSGLIIGVAASLSMAASEYLSSKEEKNKCPVKSAFYTGTAYILTVILLILPYFIFDNIYTSLFVMVLVGILIVATYTFYMSIAKEQKFWPKFIQMVSISLTVALISFIVGVLVRGYFGIEA
jgi:vacuolar iron transporter family protein